jgi:hypothetical protein
LRFVPPGRVERPLDTTEWLFAAYGEMGAYLTAVAAVVHGPITEPLLRAAMKHVQDRHPLLRARIVGGPASPRWITLTESEVDLSVCDAALIGLEQLAQDDLLRPYEPASRPLWRCTWARSAGEGSHLLVLGTHHSVADGLSGLTVFSDLIETMAALRARRPVMPNLPAGTPLDGVLQHAPLLQRMRRRLREVRTYFGTPPPVPPPLEAVAPPERRSTRLLFRTLEAPMVDGLLQRARAEHTTVAGALAAAFLEATQAHFGPLGLVELHHPISLRGSAIAPEQVGLFAGNVSTTHVLSGSPSFWSVARRDSEQLRSAIDEGSVRMSVRWDRARVVSTAATLRKLWRDPDRAGREGFLSLSSRGKWRDPSVEPFRVQALYAATSNHGLGNHFQASCGTVGESLFCTVMFVEPLHSEATGRGIADRFMAALRRESRPWMAGPGLTRYAQMPGPGLATPGEVISLQRASGLSGSGHTSERAEVLASAKPA